jgi:anti-repressor protein
MNDLQIFTYQSEDIPFPLDVRTIQRDGEPWFVLRDVCNVLGLGTPARVAERLDADEKGVSLIHTLGGDQEMTIINESGLYNVILRSDKPEAKPFRKWVTAEVLPTIRKHGAYMTTDTIEAAIADPDFSIRLLTTLKEEQAARRALEEQYKANAPKVLFADAVAASHTSILVGEMATLLRQNGVDIGGKRLFRFLRENGYLCSQGERYNLPTQRSMDRGWFEVKETTSVQPDGSIRVNRTTKISGKGQQYFIRLFLSGDATA